MSADLYWGLDKRNGYGFPAPVLQDVIDPPPPLADEPETWAEELDGEESATLIAVQQRVALAMAGYLSQEEAEWAAEEALWQLVMLLKRHGRLALPEIGTLEVVDVAAGPCLLATASPKLRGAAEGCGR